MKLLVITQIHTQVKLHNEIQYPTHANRQLSESSTVCEKYAFLIEYTFKPYTPLTEQLHIDAPLPRSDRLSEVWHQ